MPGTPIDRRSVLRLAGGAAAAAATGPTLWRQPAAFAAVPAAQVHLQFGADAAREVVVSWSTPSTVRNPRVRLGTPRGGLGSDVPAATRVYRDAATTREVITHHARLQGLRPSSRYVYEVVHDGAPPVAGSFATGPVGRAPFRFTSFGDQGTGQPLDAPTSTVFGSHVVDHVESMDPLFHLLNGDLCYGNLSHDPAGTWDRFFENNMRSARNRPWMPCAGNHENELGNGEDGYLAYRTRFGLPGNGSRDFRGNWYSFRVGSMLVVSLNNDDVCYQDGGDSYIRGYSGGAQRRWLEATLRSARRDTSLDWIVVCMHQLIMSSATTGNGCDLGVREQFGPLFDRYGVDLVLAGHDHDYERTHPVLGVESGSATLQPRVVSMRTDVVDTTNGAVHMVLGGGGSIPLNVYADPALEQHATVIVGRGETTTEPAPWSAVRDEGWPYGFACFDVDPGTTPGGLTKLEVTYYRTAVTRGAAPSPFERFTLTRRRNDSPDR